MIGWSQFIDTADQLNITEKSSNYFFKLVKKLLSFKLVDLAEKMNQLQCSKYMSLKKAHRQNHQDSYIKDRECVLNINVGKSAKFLVLQYNRE